MEASRRYAASLVFRMVGLDESELCYECESIESVRRPTILPATGSLSIILSSQNPMHDATIYANFRGKASKHGAGSGERDLQSFSEMHLVRVFISA